MVVEWPRAFFITTQYGKDDGCKFFDVDLTNQSVKDIESYGMCKVRGQIKFADLNQDGYKDFAIPLKIYAEVPASMWMNVYVGAIFNKDKRRYCTSLSAGETMQALLENNIQPKKGEIYDLRCSEE
ncbi:hypothetical protein [Collimonas sp. PA-H2]|uniref:hypothetical protein n=1 Tax=Collimonas sp. PA-H2 TaxID=1881062 RepID=UPI00117BE23B|nr:hypothetical protein [Collimonas sp. PA-H2]